MSQDALPRGSFEEDTLSSLLDANKQQYGQLQHQLLTCPPGFLVAGYQARAYAGGISYLDVRLCDRVDCFDDCVDLLTVLPHPSM